MTDVRDPAGWVVLATVRDTGVEVTAGCLFETRQIAERYMADCEHADWPWFTAYRVGVVRGA